MDGTDVTNLEAAVAAFNGRDIEPLVALMSDEMVWKGAGRAWMWWDRPS